MYLHNGLFYIILHIFCLKIFKNHCFIKNVNTKKLILKTIGTSKIIQKHNTNNMGNTESSFGLMAGSVLGGLIMAPFTGGTSLALVAAASGTGTAIGWTATTVNMLNDRRAPEGERMKHFLIGTGCGAIGPLTAGAAGFGAEVSLSVGVDVAGSAIA